jgi:hypothetical protein
MPILPSHLAPSGQSHVCPWADDDISEARCDGLPFSSAPITVSILIWPPCFTEYSYVRRGWAEQGLGMMRDMHCCNGSPQKGFENVIYQLFRPDRKSCETRSLAVPLDEAANDCVARFAEQHPSAVLIIVLHALRPALPRKSG